MEPAKGDQLGRRLTCASKPNLFTTDIQQMMCEVIPLLLSGAVSALRNIEGECHVFITNEGATKIGTRGFYKYLYADDFDKE